MIFLKKNIFEYRNIENNSGLVHKNIVGGRYIIVLGENQADDED